MIRYFSKDLRTKVTKRKGIRGGVNLDLKFQKRWWWFIFVTIDRLDINVYEYWQALGVDFNVSRGLPYQPIKNIYRYGLKTETWWPGYFDLDNRIEEAWYGILKSQANNEALMKQFENL